MKRYKLENGKYAYQLDFLEREEIIMGGALVIDGDFFEIGKIPDKVDGRDEIMHEVRNYDLLEIKTKMEL